MKIICDTTFLDGRNRFEAGETRVVDDERGSYFVGNGWARAVGGEPAEPAPATEVTLDVHKGVIGQEVRHG